MDVFRQEWVVVGLCFGVGEVGLFGVGVHNGAKPRSHGRGGAVAGVGGIT